MKRLTEKDFEYCLEELFDANDDLNEELGLGFDCLDMAVSFENAGILTNDEGLVVNFEDGQQFQITIVKSREAT